MSRSQSTPRSILLCAMASILVTICVGCRRSVDRAAIEKNRIAYAWIRETSLDTVGEHLDNARMRCVLDSKESAAESLLEATPFMALTDKQAFELAGEFSFSAATKAKPYLIRAVGPHPGNAGVFEIYTRGNGDVSVRGTALGGYNALMERRPVVAWLDQPPHELYVSFSTAR